LSTGADARPLWLPRGRRSGHHHDGGPARSAAARGGGRRWRIRRLRPADGPRLRACFQRLSAEARQARFFGAKERLTDAEVEHFCRPDGWEHIALGAFAVTADGADAELLGAARCLRLPARRDTAELAMAVADEVRGLGLGRALLKALVAHARPRGIRTLHCEVLTRNRPMRALAESFGGERSGGEDGSVTYRIPLLPAAEPLVPPAPDWPGAVLLDPVAVQHDWCTLLGAVATCTAAGLEDAGACWLPGAWLGACRAGLDHAADRQRALVGAPSSARRRPIAARTPLSQARTG